MSLETSATADPSEVKIWGTKGVHFWAFLAAILIKARPTSILELGSGRSTTFLADYAFRSRTRCVSIEQSEVWHRKAVGDLQFMHVRGEHVHHVPVVPNPGRGLWYDMARMEQLLGAKRFDFVFVDGPQFAARRNPAGQEMISKAARDARLILVDDVHRPYNLEVFDSLTARMNPGGRFFYRYGRNVLALGSEAWAGLLVATFDFLELPYETEPPSAESSTGDADD